MDVKRARARGSDGGREREVEREGEGEGEGEAWNEGKVQSTGCSTFICNLHLGNLITSTILCFLMLFNLSIM